MLSRIRWKGKRPDSLDKLKEAVEFELAAFVEEWNTQENCRLVLLCDGICRSVYKSRQCLEEDFSAKRS